MVSHDWRVYDVGGARSLVSSSIQFYRFFPPLSFLFLARSAELLLSWFLVIVLTLAHWQLHGHHILTTWTPSSSWSPYLGLMRWASLLIDSAKPTRVSSKSFRFSWKTHPWTSWWVRIQSYYDYDIFCPFRRTPFSYGNILFQTLFSKRHRLFFSWTKLIFSKVLTPSATDSKYLFNSCPAKLHAGIRFGHYVISYGERPNDYQSTSGCASLKSVLKRFYADVFVLYSDIRKKFGGSKESFVL